jgi:hypothetical protein
MSAARGFLLAMVLETGEPVLIENVDRDWSGNTIWNGSMARPDVR